METIKCFLNKYKLYDNQLNNYNKEIIDEINQILNGIIKESYDVPLCYNYVGLYYKHQIKELELAEKYYLIAIEKNYISSMNNLGRMYRDQGKYDLAKKYLLMAVNKGNKRAINNLAYVYKKSKEYDLAEKYYLMAIERNNNTSSMNSLGIMYHQRNQYEIAEKYYLMAIERNNLNRISNLADIYRWQKKFNLAEKYYLEAIKTNNLNNNPNNNNPNNNNPNNNDIQGHLGILYHHQKKYEMAEKYYLMSIEKNNKCSMHNLALLYKTQQKYKLCEKYYLMAIMQNIPEALKSFEEIYDKNILKFYRILNNISNKNDLVNNKINELKNHHEIICYENSKNILSKIDQCPICLEYTRVIPRRCAHFYCDNCFVEITKCSICRI